MGGRHYSPHYVDEKAQWWVRVIQEGLKEEKGFEEQLKLSHDGEKKKKQFHEEGSNVT